MNKGKEYKGNRVVIIFITVVILLLIWYSQVKRINQIFKETVYPIYLEQNVNYEDWDITPNEVLLMDYDGLLKRWNVDTDFLNNRSKYICLHLNVKALSAESNFNTFFKYGFRTDTYANGLDPEVFFQVNNDNINKIRKVKSGELWIVGEINVDNMSHHRFSNIDKSDFRYVLSTSLEPIEIYCKREGE